MAGNRNNEKAARAERERLRLYKARQGLHEHRVNRRRRDNMIALIAGVVVVALAVVAQVLFFVSGPGSNEAQPSPSPSPDVASEVPSPDKAENRFWSGSLVLNEVELGVEFDGVAAPQAVAAFLAGVSDGYYEDKNCHRLTNDGFYVLQCGSVDGAGASDPNFRYGPIENAPADDTYPAGTIAVARAANDAESNGRQFFIVYDDTVIPSDSAGGYTVMGRVTSGLEELKAQITDAGVQPGQVDNDGSPVVPTTITSIRLD